MLTMVMSYIMFPAVLHINKYASHFVSFFIFLSFFLFLFSLFLSFTFQFFVNAIYQYTILGGPVVVCIPQFEKPCSKL